jgi:hypothetical protein
VICSFAGSFSLKFQRADNPSGASDFRCYAWPKEWSRAMAKATGLILETPTEELPYKAVISVEGETIREQYFGSREEAEVFLVEALRGLEKTANNQGKLK